MNHNQTIADGRRQLLAWLAEDRQRQLDFLVEFAKIDTANPPGDTRDGVAFIERFLDGAGLTSARIDPQADKPNLIAHTEGMGRGPQLVLNGHVDVFPVGDPASWRHDPFGGEIADKRLIGRGVVDMKCGTTASIFAYHYLSRLIRHWHGKLTLTVVSDEETGGYWGSDYLLREHGDECLGDCVLNGEPSSVNTVRFGEKAPVWFTIEVRTDGGHGAYPHLGENAIRVAGDLMHTLYELEKLPIEMPAAVAEVLARPGVAASIEQGLGAGAGHVVPRISLNIGTIEGGVKVNMAAETCRFEVDCRLPVGITNDEFFRTCRGDCWPLSRRPDDPPGPSAGRRQFLRPGRTDAQDHTGQCPGKPRP